MYYTYERGPNYPQKDTGDYKLSFYYTQFALLFVLNRGNEFRFFGGPFLYIPLSEKCSGEEKQTYYRLGQSRTVTNNDEMIGGDLKTCLGISAGVGLVFTSYRIPLLLELKAGITLTETGIPPGWVPARKDLFISLNLNYMLRLIKS